MPEEANLDTLITMALEEDVGAGDWTTEWTVPGDARGKAVVVAKEELVVAGLEAAMRVFRRVEPGLTLRARVSVGHRVESGQVVLEAEGPLRGILTGERTALNFLGRLSGVATLTRRFADAVEATGAAILDTRKTLPGWRALEKEAVRAGGGRNHRMGLHDMVLVKDNHLVAAGGVKASVERVREANHEGIPVEVEVTSLEELDELLSMGVDRVLLDNMDNATMREAVSRIRALGDDRPLAEASGNVSLTTVRGVAETGVDLISVGSLTHSAPSADLSLRVLGDG